MSWRLIFLIVATFLSAVFQASGDAGGPVKPLSKFDHDHHRSYFADKQIDCTFCHTFKLDWQEGRVFLDSQKANTLQEPAKALCHTCHQEIANRQPSLNLCSNCHGQTADLKPENHRLDWLKKHGQTVFRATDCSTCHRDKDCIDCHRRFETMRPKMHPRNFRFIHAAQARINPASCATCHSGENCRDCHLQGKGLR